ncbi:hypothetical protein ACM46_14920 [Chryseobacterium angstadtii]|uniref:Uncharacterized protein n=1 Tax=Chryseobacterium angstadtii TaxID=558151 RepID=A0A0J7I9Z9_9FLAO|nr:hypothetical protein [Chryseobacterium angstadtii]KMQ63218.1 hypothetical protein ACM46_14920 [Chryseobacterium angstadtii]
MKKVYKNIFGEVISKAKAEKLDDYHLYYYEKDSDVLKEIEFLTEDEIYSINYFMNREDDEEEVVNYLKEKSDLFDIEKRESAGDFIITTNKIYSLAVDEKPLISKTVFYHNDPENFICSQILDNETMQPIPERTTKCWYAADKNGEKYAAIEFSYQEDGKLELAINKIPNPDNDLDWEHYEYSTFKNLQSQIDADISYYKTAVLLPKTADKEK